MKQILFTLLFLFGLGLVSCRRDKVEPDIKTYDQEQIQAYIAANGLSDMQKDTTGHSTGTDTTGIWYKIIDQGSGQPLNYSDLISYVYTIKTFDGKYTLQDTVSNHGYGLLGHLAPNGLVLALHNILKHRGGKIRVLIPSHLAYGKSGAGSGSSTVNNNRIGGNQCLDYTLYIVPDQDKYDDMIIQQYMTANNLTGYTMITSGVDSGLYYKITTAGTGSPVTINSSGTFNYVLKLVNNTVVQDYSTTTLSYSDLVGGTVSGSLIEGVVAGLELSKGGGGISILIPSRLGYGVTGVSGTIPINACLRFDITNIVVNQ